MSAEGATGTAEPAGSGRRAPYYSGSAAVGTRGLRTKQRILDAALLEFGDKGYDRSTLDGIAQRAGCSRVSIYQYFASKEDVFRFLAGQAERQLFASVDLLGPITADAPGREALRDWVARSGRIHARYAPIFRAFNTRLASDPVLPGDAARATESIPAAFVARIEGTPLPSRRLAAIVTLMIGAANQTLEFAQDLRAAHRAGYPSARLEDALADTMHRVLFGIRPEVNCRPGNWDPLPTLRLSPTLTTLFGRADMLAVESSRGNRRALACLLRVGDEVIARQGYLGTRVDDLITAAGVSRGAFYRYFSNVDDFVRIVAVRAVNAVSAAIAEPPATKDRLALRRWLRGYNAVHAERAVMIRVWLEAVDEAEHGDRAAMLDVGRRAMARLVAGRTCGDLDVEAIALFATVETFGSVLRSDDEVEAALTVIERGFIAAD